MKILLITLDSKYIHANLAVRYLKKFCKDDYFDIEIKEFTINQKQEYILNQILASKPDVICFSCYIWNIEYIKELAYIIKESNKKVEILLGGPEVSFEVKKVMEKMLYVDYIIYGEGEVTFKELLELFKNECSNLSIEKLKQIYGLCFRWNGDIILNEEREQIANLDIINYPYEENENFDDKIIYYESSRGCPFRCSFCMSSIEKTLRVFSMERVKMDLYKLLNTKARQIKFIDRTFNADYKRAMEIMKFIKENNKSNMNIHFEITADIINDEFLKFLESMPVNMFQFEIGVQSLNEDTLDEINRKMNKDRLFNVIKQIKKYENIHMHLDLIAGLPYENYNIFKRSFDGIYELNAEKIQLGFLKVLKGTNMYRDKTKHQIKYRQNAPYEVICTKYIDIEEIIKLKNIEELIDKYYNEKYFEKSIQYILKNIYCKSPFEFYENFSEYWERKDLYRQSHSRKMLYKILYDYIEYIDHNTIEFRSLLRYDYVFNNQYEEIPLYLDKENEDKFRMLKRNLANYKEFKQYYFKEDQNENKIINNIRIVEIDKNDFPILFIYRDKKNIFNRCETYNAQQWIYKINDGIKEC